MDEKTEAYIEHKVNEGIWELAHKLSHIFHSWPRWLPSVFGIIGQRP